VKNDGLAIDLKEVESLEAGFDLRQICQENRFQVRVLDIAGGNEQQLARAAL
jgi:hypothetical protein